MTSFTLYGWAVCSWALIIAFQAGFPSHYSALSGSFILVWLSHFSTQPDTGCPHMQRIVPAHNLYSYV